MKENGRSVVLSYLICLVDAKVLLALLLPIGLVIVSKVVSYYPNFSSLYHCP